MSFKKKILLSLSIFFSFLIIALMGVAFNGEDASFSSPANKVSASNEEKVLVVPNEGKNPVKTSLDFVYEPHAMAAASTSATTKVYEFAFGNTGSQTMGVDLYTNLKEMVGDGQDLNVTVSYATSATRLTSFTGNTTSSYVIPKIESGNSQYAYVILSVIDKTKPVDFTTSLDWIYGKPVDITCYIKDDSAGLDYQEQLTLIASTNIYESLTKINVRGGYGVEGYFSNAEKTDEIDSDTLVYDGIKVYFKLDTTGEFNPYNNPSWFALMGPDADADGKDDVQEYYGTKLAGVDFYLYRNFLTSKADISPYYFQVIRGNTTIKVATEASDYDSLDKLGQLIVPAQYTLKNTSLTIPVKKIESIENYNDDPSSPNYDPNPKAVFSGQTQITSIVISEGIETIGYGCFNECDSLRYIEIPSSVTYVNRRAFQFCDNLEEIKFVPRTDSVGVVFNNDACVENPKLAKITLPNNLTAIPAWCFNKNSNLRTIHIPESVTEIREDAFANCTSLTSVYFEENSTVRSIGIHTFNNCSSLLHTGTYIYDGENNNAIKEINTNDVFDMTMLENLETISRSAFYGAVITGVKFPSKLSSLSGEASGTTEGAVFQNCANLTVVEFEDNSSLTELPINTFENCSKLTTVSNLPNNIAIRDYAFENCYSLQTMTWSGGTEINTINLPSSYVGSQAFINCTSITKVKFYNNVTKINGYTFSGCEKLATVDFGSSEPESIGRLAFSHCDALKNSIINGTTYNYFKVPQGVKYIGHGAFFDSLGLEQVELPNTLVESYNLSDTEIKNGIDDYAFQACTNLKIVTLTGSSTPDAIQTLAANVFDGCINLERVEIPNNIKSIGNSVFKGCTKFTQITNNSSAANGIIILPGNNDLVINQETFANCSGLTSVAFGRIKEIGRLAFQGCTKLTEITIPNTITSISDYVFRDCSGLHTVTLNTTAFNRLPAGIFQGCGNLTSVSIPSNITAIGGSAFYNCYKFNQRNITENVTTIENNAFFNCYALEDIDLSKVTSIDHRAFTYSGLKSLTIPSTVTSIGEWAFAYCDALTTVDFSQCQADVLKEPNLFNSCKALTSVTIPKNVTEIGTNIFQSCANLRAVTFEEGSQIVNISGNSFRGTAITSILLPNSVTTISNWAFADCKSLVSIQMDYVNFIKHKTFSGCTALANTIIAGQVQNGFITTDRLVTIGYGAFHDCISLKNLEVGTNVSEIQDHAFYGAGLINVKFRLGNTNWKLYGSNQGTPTATTYGTITISSDGTKYKYGSSAEISLAVALTSTTVSIPNQGGVYMVYLHWSR